MREPDHGHNPDMGAVRWLLRRKLELGLFMLGALLRCSMSWNYDARWSYDSDLHWDYVTWIIEHGRIPPTEAIFQAQHPPLYYFLAAQLVTLGVTRQAMVWFSIACGLARLGIIWTGLELFVRSRLARVVALGLAAVIPAAVHLDGMVYTESLSCTLNTLALLLVPLAFRREGRERWLLTAAVGLTFGLAILTKVSAVATIAAVVLAAAYELLFDGKPLRVRLQRSAPWAGALVVLLVVSGWYYRQNLREYGKPFVTTFELRAQSWLMKEANQHPVADRRSLGFVFGWSDAVYKTPYRPAGLSGHPRFFPVAVASTFVDYWGFGFAGYDRTPEGVRSDGMRPGWKVQSVARLSVLGGTTIFFAAAAAWLAGLVHVLRTRDPGRLALLLVPLVALAASLLFAIQHPIDNYGVIKGVYMTFAAAPLYALFGIAAGWASKTPVRWPLLALMLVSLCFVAAYSIACRLDTSAIPVKLFGA
jgi:4-amino-4-deoxy-L-arabinose transferase-like glycosyltransferase